MFGGHASSDLLIPVWLEDVVGEEVVAALVPVFPTFAASGSLDPENLAEES